MYLGIDANNWIATTWFANGGSKVAATVRHRAEALIRKVRPSAVAVCFDCHSFRYDLWPAYKANRPPKPPGFREAMEESRHALRDVGQVIEEEGAEADDCLATLARIGVERGRRVVLASGDKDLRQSIMEGKVIQLRSFRCNLRQGRHVFESPEWYNVAELFKETGLTPSQWPSYQALCGDSSDGIPGCIGWGPKTTLKAMATFPMLSDILEHIGELPVSDRLRANLAMFSVQADLMLRLVTLRTDVKAVEAVR